MRMDKRIIADNNNRAIASFQSGGAMGYISAFLADNLTQEVDKPFHEIFERVYGTSAGAINSAALWPLRATGEPLFTPPALRKFYLDNTDDIFEKRWWAAGGALANISDIENLERILEEQLGDLKLSDFADGLGITVLDADTKEVRVLTSDEAARNSDMDFKMVDLVRAAANAPFYFDQKSIQSMAGNMHQFTDAGLVCPDQSVSVYGHLHDLYGTDNVPFFVSIGSGISDNKYDIEEWSGVAQTRSVLGLQFEAAAKMAEDQMTRIMGPKFLELNMHTGALRMDSAISDIHQFTVDNEDSLKPELFAPLLEHLTPQGAKPNAPLIGQDGEAVSNDNLALIIDTRATQRTL